MKKTALLIVTIATTLVVAKAQMNGYNKKNRNANKSADSAAIASKPSAEVLPMPATPKVKKDYKKIDLTNRTADHFMIQFGGDGWLNKPDSVKTSGFSRHFNMYFMLDKPFKSDPHFSIGLGAGIGSSNIFFDNSATNLNIKGNGSSLAFKQTGSAYFDKYKLTTIFLEIPVELRYYSNPENPNKSWKAALGVKVGTLIKAYTKGKNLVDQNGSTVYGSSYIIKESSTKFFNSTKLAATARVGYGIFSLHGDFSITPVIKDGFGSSMNAFAIGLTVSGL